MVDQRRRDELNDALELMHFAFRAVIARPDEILLQHGLARMHHRILYFVGRNPGVSVNRLLECMKISKQALHGPLRSLVEKGLVAAAPAPGDRRVKQLTLTEAGAQLEDLLSGDQRQRFESAFGRAGSAKEAAWREVMRLLAEPRG